MCVEYVTYLGRKVPSQTSRRVQDHAVSRLSHTVPILIVSQGYVSVETLLSKMRDYSSVSPGVLSV